MSEIKAKILEAKPKNPEEAHELFSKLKGYESLKALSTPMLERELKENKELQGEAKAAVEGELKARAEAHKAFLARKEAAPAPDAEVNPVE